MAHTRGHKGGIALRREGRGVHTSTNVGKLQKDTGPRGRELCRRRRTAKAPTLRQCTPRRHEKQSEASELDPRTRSTSASLQRCWCGRGSKRGTTPPPPPPPLARPLLPPSPPPFTRCPRCPSRGWQRRGFPPARRSAQRQALLLVSSNSSSSCRSISSRAARGVAGRCSQN